jgi:hypothetical protein
VYTQAVKGVATSLPPLPVQFGDYIIWQYRTAAAWLREHGDYWKSRLSDAPRIKLPINEGLMKPQAPTGAMLQIPFGETRSVGLRELARREHTLLPIVVLTAYAAVISRWYGQRDVLLGFASHGRYRSELRDMIGLLVTSLYLRIQVAAEDSFVDLLKRVDREFHTAHDHQGIDWIPGFITEPITDLGFNWSPIDWANGTVGCAREIDDQTRLLPFSLKRAPWPTSFQPIFSDSDRGIVMTVVYQPDLFALDTIEWFGCNLRLFADELVRKPHTRVASFPMSRGYYTEEPRCMKSKLD